MLIKLYNENRNPRTVREVVDVLRNGGIIIYPTDTVYGLGCDITKPRAIERIARIKGIKPEKANFSFIVYDLSHLSDFTKPIGNEVYRMMRKNLPGPFTFILDANSNVPKLMKSKKKTVGIRIPDNNIILDIVKELGNPILTTSVHSEDEVLEYTTDPELIEEEIGHLVDLVVDGGYGNNIPSAIVDCTGNDIEVIRQGEKELEY